LPLFLQDFTTEFPGLNIVVREETTAEIQRKLKSWELDNGILSIPLSDKELYEECSNSYISTMLTFMAWPTNGYEPINGFLSDVLFKISFMMHLGGGGKAINACPIVAP
jgi:hypothetical protein